MDFLSKMKPIFHKIIKSETINIASDTSCAFDNPFFNLMFFWKTILQSEREFKKRENKKIHHNSNSFQRKSLNSFRVLLFRSAFHSLSLGCSSVYQSVPFSREKQKNFFFLFIENESWMAGKQAGRRAAIKIYSYKMMRSHSEFRTIFGFLLLMFLVEWNPMKTCSIHEFAKRTHTNESHHSTHIYIPQYNMPSLDFQLAIFISYWKAVLQRLVSPLLITKTNKYRSKFIVVVCLSYANLSLRVCASMSIT